MFTYNGEMVNNMTSLVEEKFNLNELFKPLLAVTYTDPTVFFWI